MTKIFVEKLDQVNLRVWSELDVEMELDEFFSFFADGYKFMPKFRGGLWDGKIRMYSVHRKTLAVGLYAYLCKFAEDNQYEIVNNNPYIPLWEVGTHTYDEVKSFMMGLDVRREGKPITPHGFQIEAVLHSLNENRALLLSATGSGKSLIIYALLRWHLAHGHSRMLLVVPTKGLVKQMISDFKDYSTHNKWDVDKLTQIIYAGFTKEVSTAVTVSTWQSIYKLDKKWFNQFQCFIGDEAHLFAGASLTTCMSKMTEVAVRIGTTGTIKDAKSNKLTLEGHFAPAKLVSTSRDLMDAGVLTDLKIKCLVLQYDKDVCKAVNGYDYQNEINYIVGNDKRNAFIRNLAFSLKGTTLVLFQFVEKHGVPMYKDFILNKPEGRQVYIIHGGIDVEERELIRLQIEKDTDPIVIASYATFATGTNAPSIENIIFSSPSKAKIRNLQSIGRGLRLKPGKAFCNLYDISDDFSHKKKANTTLRHAFERIKQYTAEQFPYKLYEIPLK